MSEYRSFYGGRSGRRTGAGTAGSSDTIWNIQHPEWSERGTGIGPAKNVLGRYGPGRIPGNKITKCIYTHKSSGYKFLATEAPSAHSGGIAIFYRTADHFSVEAFQVHGANVVSFQLESGDRQWYIVGC